VAAEEAKEAAEEEAVGGSSVGVGTRADKRRGVSANFKISNPNKVSCTVDFTVKARGGESKSAAATAAAAVPDGAFPMEVQPALLDIPPHEHRYVTVYFAPRAIATYQAVFEATVKVDPQNPY
jgi:hydrocephalus-inducing protein